MWIGESTDETNTAMSGDIKDVRLYNVCLTPSEINMKKKAQGISAQMVAHWPMDDGGGTTVADVVGGNDGTLTTIWIVV